MTLGELRLKKDRLPLLRGWGYGYWAGDMTGALRGALFPNLEAARAHARRERSPAAWVGVVCLETLEHVE